MDDILDREAVLNRLGGSHELFTELARCFREDAPQLLAQANHGIAAADAAEVALAAHSLKGLALHFNAVIVADAAGELETTARSEDLHTAIELLRHLEPLVTRLAGELRDV